MCCLLNLKEGWIHNVARGLGVLKGGNGGKCGEGQEKQREDG